MSRRIVSAKMGYNFHYQRDVYKQVGQFVNVDCKSYIMQDYKTKEYVTFADSFCVSNRADRKEIGRIVSVDDVEWLKQASIADHASPMLFRIHQSDIPSEDGSSGFSLEVLTGSDARFYVRNEETEFWLAFILERWWKIGLGLLFAWWWLGS